MRTAPKVVQRFPSVDPLAESYTPWSPYNYVMGNPIKFIDPDGRSVDKVDPSDLIKTDKDNGTNFHHELTADLQAKTGVTIGIGEDGMWTVESVDENVGSETAREDLLSAINSEETIDLRGNAGGGTFVPHDNNGEGRNVIEYDGYQSEDITQNTVGADQSTMGAAFQFLHELQHTKVGGNLTDDVFLGSIRKFGKGQTVRKVNKMRQEVGLPERGSYSPQSAGAGQYDYIPLSKSAKKAIKRGQHPSKQQPHIKISKLKRLH